MAAPGTPWFKLFSQLRDHPKLEDLIAELSVNDAEAVGHLVLLWCWVTDYHPDGDVSGVTNKRIARAARWHGDADLFVASLLRCGWLDGGPGAYRLHNWMTYAESYKRAKSQKSKRSSEDTSGTKSSTGTVPVQYGQSTGTVPTEYCGEERRGEEKRGEEESTRAPDENDLSAAPGSPPDPIALSALIEQKQWGPDPGFKTLSEPFRNPSETLSKPLASPSEARTGEEQEGEKGIEAIIAEAKHRDAMQWGTAPPPPYKTPDELKLLARHQFRWPKRLCQLDEETERIARELCPVSAEEVTAAKALAEAKPPGNLKMLVYKLSDARVRGSPAKHHPEVSTVPRQKFDPAWERMKDLLIDHGFVEYTRDEVNRALSFGVDAVESAVAHVRESSATRKASVLLEHLEGSHAAAAHG